MPEAPEDPPIAVFKIGAAEHMTDLVKNGHVYMNTAAYYAELEAADPRTDPNEGASYIKQATGGTFSMEVDGEFVPIGTITGPVIHTSDDLKGANIYCLHARRRSSYDQVFGLSSLGFGDTAVIFLDIVEFLRRVTEAAHRAGHRVSYQLVEYVGRDTYSGPLGLFRKFSKFADQLEHRIAILPGVGGPLSLHMGSLEDITLTVSAEDHLELTPKTKPSE
jgi:hypothetical protein